MNILGSIKNLLTYFRYLFFMLQFVRYYNTKKINIEHKFLIDFNNLQ